MKTSQSEALVLGLGLLVGGALANCGCGGVAPGQGEIETGIVQQDLDYPRAYGFDSNLGNTPRCDALSSTVCNIPRYKGLFVIIGTGWTTTERQVLSDLTTAVMQSINTSAPTWALNGMLVTTTGTCGSSNQQCVQIDKLAESTPSGTALPAAQFVDYNCTAQSSNINESPVNLAGVYRYCDRAQVNFAGNALVAWDGVAFNTSSNKLRQAIGGIVARLSGLGETHQTGVVGMTSDTFTRHVNANNTITAGETCRLQNYHCPTANGIGCTSNTTNLALGNVCLQD